jgi:hypothetical protein
MSEQHLGTRSLSRSLHRSGSGIVIDPREASAPPSPPAGPPSAGVPAQLEKDQLARDIADIERAAAALRRAEPALQSWSRPHMPTGAKPRPLWLLIGLLWLSTAIVTVGAAFTIASLAG